MLSTDENIPIYAIFNAIVREFRTTDLSFIMKTWLRAYQPERYHVPKYRYYAKQQELIRKLCAQEHSRIAVVCDEASPDFMVGFAIAYRAPASYRKPMVVHYIYVKEMYRKQGFAEMMLLKLGWVPGRKILATHWNRSLQALKNRWDLEYDDWILKGIVNHDEQ